MLPEEIKKLNTLEGYFDEWYKLRKEDNEPTNKQIYEEIEARYFEAYGQTRYRSYESFKNAKHRYLDALFRKAQRKRLENSQKS